MRRIGCALLRGRHALVRFATASKELFVVASIFATVHKTVAHSAIGFNQHMTWYARKRLDIARQNCFDMYEAEIFDIFHCIHMSSGLSRRWSPYFVQDMRLKFYVRIFVHQLQHLRQTPHHWNDRPRTFTQAARVKPSP